MSEIKLISPLLDGFALGNPMSEHDGVRCCPAIKENSDKKYIVKIISIPASQVQMDALLLAGAYKDPEDAMDYFKVVAGDVLEEAQFLKDLSRLDGFLPYDGWQMEPITKRRLGFEVYLVGSYKRSLEKHVRRNPVTHLEAVNLGLDLCAALSVCRQAGALYVDLKPSNIFLSNKKEYRIGDLGFIKLDAMKYTALPEKYRSCYTPPELHDPMAALDMTVDTYGVGMILYQLYNEGTLPFKEKAPDEELPPPVNADYELAEIIMKAIHPDPAKRWNDPKEMGQALVTYMQRNVINDVPITPYTPLDIQAQDVRIPQEQTEKSETPPSEEKPAEEAAPTEADAPAEKPEAEPEDSPTEEISDTEPSADDSISEADSESVSPAEPEAEAEPEAAPESVPEADPQEAAAQEISDELSRIFAKADDLISHETPVGVVLPEIPEEPDPFAFALEDSEELDDLSIPLDPIMEDASDRKKKKKAKSFRSPERKKKIKRFFSRLLTLLILALMGCGAFWYYQNIYLQTIDSIRIDSATDRLTVTIASDVDETLLIVSCSDNYGNTQTQSVTNGQAVFTDLLPNTMYQIQVDIDGFHALVGQTSDVFTTDTTTSIVSFTAVTGQEDGSVLLNFTVDGEEPSEWTLVYSAEGEEERRETFTGHSITISGLSLGKVYTFTLDAGEALSLSGSTSVDFMASRLVLAEDLTVTTTSGTDMTIRWNAPGDILVDSWDVRCYNENGYEEQMTVTQTEVYLTGIDSSVSYTVEVTASGMTQPARTSITANPINITALNADESDYKELKISWDYAGAEPKEGWLLMYSVDGSSNLNVIKCDTASATIAPRIPGAKYQFTIQSVDGTSIFGNVHTYTCPEAAPFDENGLSKENISINLLKTPDKKDWRYDNISSDSFTDQFALGDSISIILHGSSNFYLPGMELDILYVIRDAYGNVLTDFASEEEGYWKELWYAGDYHYGELTLPTVPDKAGSYTLSIYFNGASVAEAGFTIAE